MANVYITLTSTSGDVDTGFSVYLVDASSDDITLTLPDITSDGPWFLFRRVDTVNTNTVTIQGFTSSQTIDGAVSVQLGVGASGAIASYNGVWWRL